MDNYIDRFGTHGVVSTVRLLDEEPSPLDPSGSFHPAVLSTMSDVASQAVTLGSIAELSLYKRY